MWRSFSLTCRMLCLYERLEAERFLSQWLDAAFLNGQAFVDLSIVLGPTFLRGTILTTHILTTF